MINRREIAVRFLAASLSLLIIGGGLAGCNLTRQNQNQPPSVNNPGAQPTQAVGKPAGGSGQTNPSNPAASNPGQAPGAASGSASGGAVVTQPAGSPSVAPTTAADAALDQDLQQLQNLNNSADNLDDQP